MTKKFDLNDILIEPAIFSDIDSRGDVNPTDHLTMLPIFTAPMFDVVSDKNWRDYAAVGIYSIIPRKPSGMYTVADVINTSAAKWTAMGLADFNSFFGDGGILQRSATSLLKTWILIDMANGHMQHLYDSVKFAKAKWGDKLVLMVGNIANPHTYKAYSQIGVDYCRLSIGSGSGCLTSVQTAVGYPMASLIHECKELANKLVDEGITPSKIVADGGIRSYSDIIKALALGADYVMMGGTLNKAIESASPYFIKIGGIYLEVGLNGNTFSHPHMVKDYIQQNLFKYDQYIGFTIRGKINGKEVEYACSTKDKYDFTLHKRYRGMSTKEVQEELGNKILKTSEGIKKYNEVEYSLSGWTENFIHYLSSAMSYTGFKNLDEFIGGPDWNLITGNAQLRFDK